MQESIELLLDWLENCFLLKGMKIISFYLQMLKNAIKSYLYWYSTRSLHDTMRQTFKHPKLFPDSDCFIKSEKEDLNKASFSLLLSYFIVKFYVLAHFKSCFLTSQQTLSPYPL